VSNFAAYAAFYDLLYGDKDYAAEADYVAAVLRGALPGVCTLLEFGSGTGSHGRMLAARGFDVLGIERSQQMLALAAADPGPRGRGQFSCKRGDICTVRIGRSFDAVIALFHVVSYQTTNDALRATFRTAEQHLKPGGLFLFDVWHGPAVLTEPPSERIKEASDVHYRVRRIARPKLDTNSSTVVVKYEIQGEDRSSGQAVRFDEEHVMRYLFPTEVELLAQGCGLHVVMAEEFLTRQRPSSSTWGVAYLLRRPA
jgi:SAM-dependent methyltransferase